MDIFFNFIFVIQYHEYIYIYTQYMYFIPDSPDMSFIALPEKEIYTHTQTRWSSQHFICCWLLRR